MKYQLMYEDASYQSMEKVAQELGITRARVSQLLNLLKLDQRIIDFIQNITNPRQNNFWNEHRLRSIAVLPKEKQYAKFKKILLK
jgi:predicted transcriptional regulator